MKIVLDTNVLFSALISPHAPPHRIGHLVNVLARGPLVAVAGIRPELPDPADAFLLTLAAAADADYLVTGDHRAGLLEMAHYGRTRIVTPAKFCAEVLKG